MHSFSDKDFFGDPIWPKDFGSLKKESKDLGPFESKLVLVCDQNENSSNYQSHQAESQDHEDFEKNFIANEKKMLYSNLKHSEVTYFDDQNKGLEFSKDDIESHEKMSQGQINEEIHSCKVKQEAQNEFQKQLFDLPHLSEYSSQIYSQSQSQSEAKPENVSTRRPKNLSSSRHKFTHPKVKIQPQLSEQEMKLITEVMNEQIFMIDNDERKKKMEGIQDTIIRKLRTLQKDDKPKCKMEDIFDQKREIKRKKTHKYKILTEAEKSYIVYLSTLTTTCEVARRFGISVNNICRWKKGTKRKQGAGRKIVNKDLEQNVIDYVQQIVKSGQQFTRKQIQTKAKELSGNTHFKASKGWFERFYNRNIDIFTKP